jgi:TfoX/Sxy family transcriptional regulator of competence genes
MAYDEALADRVRSIVALVPGVSEKRMFGGIAFLKDGKMFVGLATADLMVRVGPAHHEEALSQPDTRPMDFTGRPMVGYVYVAAEGLDEDGVLRGWVQRALDFVDTLPKKAEKARAKPASSKAPARGKPVAGARKPRAR